MLTVNQTIDNGKEDAWNEMQSFVKRYNLKPIRWIDVIERGLNYYKRQCKNRLKDWEEKKSK